jgi:hypothetical protein
MVEGVMQKRRKARMGRPPRTDNPVRVGLMLPGAVRDWLQARARVEGRTQSDVLVRALAVYRKQVGRRAAR